MARAIPPLRKMSRHERKNSNSLEPLSTIRPSTSLHNMAHRTLPHSQIHQRRNHKVGVQNIARIDERSRRRVGKLRKSQCGLLCGNKGAGGVDRETALELRQFQGKGVVWGIEICSGGYWISIARVSRWDKDGID